jgi:hypothetical protein
LGITQTDESHSLSASVRKVNRKSLNHTALIVLTLLMLYQEHQSGQGQELLREEVKSGIFWAGL